MPSELRILVFRDRHGRPTVSLVGDGVPHHRVQPARDARQEVIDWLIAAEHHLEHLGERPHPRTLDDLVSRRAAQLTEQHGLFASPHEMYGVIFEEVCEFFDIVKQRESMRSTTKMIRELVDIASAALRAANQLAGAIDHDPTDAEVLNA
jgi:NTP pyrophosphatase (non-canonical NTP hydrolase)